MNINQELEQLEAFLRDLAPVLGTYKKCLVQEGFSEGQAFLMTKQYQKSLIEGAQKQ